MMGKVVKIIYLTIILEIIDEIVENLEVAPSELAFKMLASTSCSSNIVVLKCQLIQIILL